MSTIWVNKPKRLYLIEADGEIFKHETEYLNYKTVCQDLRRRGYKKINISCLGFAIHNNY